MSLWTRDPRLTSSPFCHGLLDFSNEELDQLLDERQKRIHRENLAGSVLLKYASGNSAAKVQLCALFDQHLEQDHDRKLYGLMPRGR